MHIWLYLENASRKQSSWQPEALSTKESMLGSGYESLWQVLFKSVKSTHILHFPFAFFTNTMFASHPGYWISLMWIAFKSFCVSYLMTRRLSSFSFLLLCITCLTFSSMVSLWHRKSGYIPGMSAQDRAKTLMCLAITSAILSCNSWPSDVPSVEPSGVQALKNPNPLKDVEGLGACCCWVVLVRIWGSLSFVIHSRLNPKHRHSQSFKRKVFSKLSEKQPIVLYLDDLRKDWKLFFKWLSY